MSALEDLAISTYEHVGCLNMKNEYHLTFQQELSNDKQESSSYQIFSSSIMNAELCFRLCRRWTILVYNNLRCICLYTLSEHHQLARLGEWTLNCTSGYFVYALGENKSKTNRAKFNPLTKISTTVYPAFSGYDWSLDGCYYFHEIQRVIVDLRFESDYELGMQACMRVCLVRNNKSGYFFMSRKKYCYCSASFIDAKILFISTTALRKSLKQCSFLTPICSAIKNTVTNSCQQYIDDTSFDTLVKIDYKMYCLNNTFEYSRALHQCIQLISLGLLPFYQNYKQLCSISKTFQLDSEQQWIYLITNYLPAIVNDRPKTSLWIDRNSKYAYKLLTQTDKSIYNYSNEQQCLILYPTLNSWNIKIVSCQYHYAYYGLCQTEAIEQNPNLMEEFILKLNNNTNQLMKNNTILECPSPYISFNDICYYSHQYFVDNLRKAERLCELHNGQLTKFQTHEWGNVNLLTLLNGSAERSLNDARIELFSYHLENTIYRNWTQMPEMKKHWLRLLLGSTKSTTTSIKNECVLRYYAHASGGFTMLNQCQEAGHPVCIADIIQRDIRIGNKNESTSTMSLSTIAIVENKTESNNNTSELFIYDCKNCTADEDLYNNVTNISSPLYSFDSTSKSHHLLNRYTFTLSVTAACVVFLLLSLVGALCYFRRRQSYSFTATPTRAVTLSPTATVVYKRLKTKQQLKKSNKKTDDQHSSELLLDENVDLISNVRLSSLENEIHQAEK